jgi:hypothetical protein
MQEKYATLWVSARSLAPALLGMALFTGCGSDASSTTASTDDATSAYAALTGKLQQCGDDADTCTTAANGDATKVAACDAAEKTCKDKTSKEEADAHSKLGQAASDCYKGPGHGHDEDGGVADKKGRDDRRACVEHHAPQLPPCFEDLLSCLEKTAGPGAGQDAALTACVDTAHTCIMSSMPTHGAGPGHAEAGSSGGFPHAGSVAPHPGEHAGAGGGFEHAGSIAPFPGERAGHEAPGHASGGAGGEPAHGGPGPRAGAPAHEEAGAGGGGLFGGGHR